jgi:hypothetical protein
MYRGSRSMSARSGAKGLHRQGLIICGTGLAPDSAEMHHPGLLTPPGRGTRWRLPKLSAVVPAALLGLIAKPLSVTFRGSGPPYPVPAEFVQGFALVELAGDFAPIVRIGEGISRRRSCAAAPRTPSMPRPACSVARPAAMGDCIGGPGGNYHTTPAPGLAFQRRLLIFGTPVCRRVAYAAPRSDER